MYDITWCTASSVLLMAAAWLSQTHCQSLYYTTPNPSVWSFENYPDPRWNFFACGRENTSSVCDPNNIITKVEADELDRLIADVLKTTRCKCIECLQNKRGYQIRVAIMAEMKPIYNMSLNIVNNLLNARTFTWLLSTKYRLDGLCNETLIIVFARNNGILYTMTRRQARVGLPDRDVVAITEDNRKYFDDPTTVGKGIAEMIKSYRHVLLGNTYKRPVAMRSRLDNNGSDQPFSSLLLLFVCATIYQALHHVSTTH